jgi:hypothetical protein
MLTKGARVDERASVEGAAVVMESTRRVRASVEGAAVVIESTQR